MVLLFVFETHDAKSMAASLSQSLSGFACVQLLRQLAFHKVGKMMSRCRQFVCFTILRRSKFDRFSNEPLSLQFFNFLSIISNFSCF